MSYNLGAILSLFAPPSNVALFWPVNSVKFCFSLSSSTPTNNLLQVEIYLAETSGLLEGSIYHNFSSISGQSINCYFNKVGKSLVCVNVSNLLQN